MLLTPHFSLDEFKQPAGYELPETPYPADWIESRLAPLCLVLEAVRTELRDMPIVILSGYRSKLYNQRHHIKHPGAVILSQHCYGRAADIEADHYTPFEIHTALLRLYHAQMIVIGGLGIYDKFVHVDIRQSSTLQQWKG